ncbi:hypothetical protein B4144_3255 [Bacillus atrophaeus]|nr:hypothetical protein B4144_3255 [Bacillus atrophaeus]
MFRASLLFSDHKSHQLSNHSSVGTVLLHQLFSNPLLLTSKLSLNRNTALTGEMTQV